MNDDPYVYTGTFVLRNRLDIREADELDRVERQLVRERILEGIPRGNFDLRHLKAIHFHLFQDIYEWAGQVALSRFPRAKASSSSGSISKRAWPTFIAVSSRPAFCAA